MIDTNTAINLLKISNKILEIVENKDEMPNGDYQACIEAQTMTAYLLGKGK